MHEKEKWATLLGDILVRATKKYHIGVTKYGEEIKTDPWDELKDEVADLLNYLILKLVKLEEMMDAIRGKTAN